MEDAAELQKKVEEMVAKVATMQVAQQPLDVIRIRDAISSADIGHGVRGQQLKSQPDNMPPFMVTMLPFSWPDSQGPKKKKKKKDKKAGDEPNEEGNIPPTILGSEEQRDVSAKKRDKPEPNQKSDKKRQKKRLQFLNQQISSFGQRKHLSQVAAYARATQGPAQKVFRQVPAAICPRALYAKPGTDIAYGAPRSLQKGWWSAPLSGYVRARRCPPSAYSYTNIINAYVRSGERGRRQIAKSVAIARADWALRLTNATVGKGCAGKRRRWKQTRSGSGQTESEADSVGGGGEEDAGRDARVRPAAQRETPMTTDTETHTETHTQQDKHRDRQAQTHTERERETCGHTHTHTYTHTHTHERARTQAHLPVSIHSRTLATKQMTPGAEIARFQVVTYTALLKGICTLGGTVPYLPTRALRGVRYRPSSRWVSSCARATLCPVLI
eukprot:2881420-Rhodomonas_salina.1